MTGWKNIKKYVFIGVAVLIILGFIVFAVDVPWLDQFTE